MIDEYAARRLDLGSDRTQLTAGAAHATRAQKPSPITTGPPFTKLVARPVEGAFGSFHHAHIKPKTTRSYARSSVLRTQKATNHLLPPVGTAACSERPTPCGVTSAPVRTSPR